MLKWLISNYIDMKIEKKTVIPRSTSKWILTEIFDVHYCLQMGNKRVPLWHVVYIGSLKIWTLGLGSLFVLSEARCLTSLHISLFFCKVDDNNVPLNVVYKKEMRQCKCKDFVCKTIQ